MLAERIGLGGQGSGTMSARATARAVSGPFTIFAVILALYMVAHHIYLFFGLGFGRAGLTLLVLPAAFALLMWPRNLAIFAFAVALHVFQTLMMLPTGSNHTIMSMFLMTGLGIAYVHTAWVSRRANVDLDRFHDAFAPLGRWLLIIMYFYGTLHKVNTDFLNPISSCAISMWRRYGFPEFIAESGVIHTATIYGTLMVEATAIAMLLTRRFRWAGIVLGVSFHGFLGLLPPGRIVAYSLLSILLHTLFLPKVSLHRFNAGTLGRWLTPLLTELHWRVMFGLGGVMALIILPWFASWGLFLAAAIAFVTLYGREPRAEETAGSAAHPPGRWLVSPIPVLNVLAVLFFLNGASPYLGFKTGQTISMFSNLITEGGRSNHLIVPNLPVFSHQSRVATLKETDQPALAHLQKRGYKLVEFHVLDYLERSPGASATYMVDGVTYRHSPAQPLPAVANLPPRWLRNLMVFKPVVLESPRMCDQY